MKKMKVLQVIGNLQIGGAENVAMNYFRYIDRSKYDYHYLVYGDEIGSYESEVKKLGGKVIRMNYSNKKLGEFYRNLRSLCNQEKYDIVHSHTMFNNGVVLSAAKHAGVPKRISHAHTVKYRMNSQFVYNLYEAIMRKNITKNATHFLACSNLAGEYLFGYNFFHQFGKIVVNGVNTDNYKFDLETRNQIRDELKINNKVVLGHVGHLSSVKNQKYLLEILKEIDCNKYVLLFIGDGADRGKLVNKSIELGIENSVFFTGNVDDVNRYLNALDVFLFPSLYEGLGMSVIEAQANGLPCIVSENIPEEVFITDLVKSLPISAIDKGLWVKEIKQRERDSSSEYANKVNDSGYDVRQMGREIEFIYSS